jgi:uncharacterized SAM-binding protein YcdF (DUF218 family)
VIRNSISSTRTRRIFALVIATLIIWPLLAWLAAHFLIVSSPLPQADAIVVLSGSSTYRERTRHAAEVFKAGRAKLVLLTNDNQKGGWSQEEERNPFYYELERMELELSGVPRQSIEVILDPVTGTYEESILLRQYAEAHGIKSLLVVTSAYHSRRAWWTLRKVFGGSAVSVGLEAVGTGLQTPTPATWWFHINGWRLVPGEYVKFAYYLLWLH